MKKKYNEAITSFSRASFLDTCESSIYFHRAQSYLEVLDFETAIRNYRQCLKMLRSQSRFVTRRLATVLQIWGGILLDSRRYEEAIEILDESLNLGAPEYSCTLKR